MGLRFESHSAPLCLIVKHLELSRTCLHYVCVSFSFFLIYIFIADNISISINIMCVILCFFSDLSRRVGALQIVIIIII